jgi:hypothetical protein
MIARISHGYTKPEHADACEALLKAVITANRAPRRSRDPHLEERGSPVAYSKLLAHGLFSNSG